MKNRRTLLVISLLLALVVVSLIFVLRYLPDSDLEDELVPTEENQSWHYPTIRDAEFYDETWSDLTETETSKAIGAIIPHHLTAKELIAELLTKIGAGSPSVIVVMGPDHDLRGLNEASTSDYNWQTPYGTLPAAEEIIAKLVNSGLVGYDPLAMEHEFSVSNEMPFIAKVFPDSQIVPLILQDTMPARQSFELAIKLNEILPAKALVIVSMDFSHETTKDVAKFRDVTANEVISRFAYPDIDLLELDTKPSLRTLLKYCALRGATDWNLVANSNSSEIMNEDFPDTTSYITGYFQ